MSEQALEGLTVIEWGGFIAAPFCTLLLAQLGAEVIKVEAPGLGDDARRYGPFPKDEPHPEKSGLFLCLNMNKFGITLDPGKPKGRKILLDLLMDADIFVVNQPGLNLTEMGLDYDSLKRLNPRLIMTAVTPFGQTGPYAKWKGFDLHCCALGGITGTIGYPDREPLTPPLYQGHHQVGLMAATATMLAVLQRDLTEEGCFIDIAEADVWATIHIGMGIQSYLEEGRVRTRSGHMSPHRPYPDEVLPCKDGAVCIDTPQNRQWQRFLEVMGNPEWAKDPIFEDRIQTTDRYWQKADAYLAQWLRGKTKSEVFQLLQQARVPAAPLRTIDEVAEDEHMRQRQYFVEADHPDAGKFRFYPGVCYKFSKTPLKVNRPAPRLGEHNDMLICRKLGYSEEELTALRGEEVM